MSYTPKEEDGLIRLSGWRSGTGWQGNGQLANGTWVDWTLSRKGDAKATDDKKEKKKDELDSSLGDVIYPFIAHGSTTLPQQQTILITNATLWTNEADGIVETTDILLKDGKISAIGKNLSASGAISIDGAGKHVTSGIIDEHSHIGASGINDVAVNSSMVRIGDVINPEHINIYRITLLFAIHLSLYG